MGKGNQRFIDAQGRSVLLKQFRKIHDVTNMELLFITNPHPLTPIPPFHANLIPTRYPERTHEQWGTTMYDILVIGGGPAGTTAALRARELGAKTALVERGLLGGTCTNDGCVPTRVLAKAARLLRDSQQFADYGLDAPLPTVDFARLMARTQQVVYQVQEKKQLLDHLEGLGVEVFHNVGGAQFEDDHTVRLADDRLLEGQQIILCAGGRARRLDVPGGEHALIHSDVWQMTVMPRSVAIIGGGATGCQLASVFNAFGADTLLMDVAKRLLPPEDELVSSTIMHEFERDGIEVLVGIGGVKRIEPLDAGGYELTIEVDGQEETRTVDAVIASVGWPSNGDTLNLAAAGVEMNGPFVKVDDYLRTSVPHIFAAGDVTGRMLLVQSASHQARVAVENAMLGRMGIERTDENRLVPHGGFTDPEYAGVGLTEEQARKNGKVAVATVPYSDMDRAVIDGRPVGFCKIIVDPTTHRLLGAHVVGEQAVEAVNILATAIAGELKVETLSELEFAYPTFAAVIGLAARQLARELRAVPLHSQWHELGIKRLAEWERRAETQ